MYTCIYIAFYKFPYNLQSLQPVSPSPTKTELHLSKPLDRIKHKNLRSLLAKLFYKLANKL